MRFLRLEALRIGWKLMMIPVFGLNWSVAYFFLPFPPFSLKVAERMGEKKSFLSFDPTSDVGGYFG
jgi:hypothetical protein